MCRDGPPRTKKNELQPWRKKSWCIPEKDRARFVAQMEVVLDTYAAEHSPEEPLICMDEASKQLTVDEVEPIPLQPGHVAKEDYHYGRNGYRPSSRSLTPCEAGDESVARTVGRGLTGPSRCVACWRRTTQRRAR